MNQLFKSLLFIGILNFGLCSNAETEKAKSDSTSVDNQAVPNSNQLNITVKDAKKSCKDSGKQGAELLKCIQEKTKSSATH